MASASTKKKRSAAENEAEYVSNYKKFKAGKLSGNEAKYLQNQEGVRKLPKSQRDQVKKANKYASSTTKKAPVVSKGENSELGNWANNMSQKPPKDIYELQQMYPKAPKTKGTSSNTGDSSFTTNPPKDIFELRERQEAAANKKLKSSTKEMPRSGPGGAKRRYY